MKYARVRKQRVRIIASLAVPQIWPWPTCARRDRIGDHRPLSRLVCWLVSIGICCVVLFYSFSRWLWWFQSGVCGSRIVILVVCGGRQACADRVGYGPVVSGGSSRSGRILKGYNMCGGGWRVGSGGGLCSGCKKGEAALWLWRLLQGGTRMLYGNCTWGLGHTWWFTNRMVSPLFLAVVVLPLSWYMRTGLREAGGDLLGKERSSLQITLLFILVFSCWFFVRFLVR